MKEISMVPFEKLLDLYFDAYSNKEQDPLSPFETAFENGMLEVIKQVAQTKLHEYHLTYEAGSADKRAATEQAIAAFQNALDLASTPEQKKALMEIDSTYSCCSTVESDEHFIAGFVAGYRFLKELEDISKK